MGLHRAGFEVVGVDIKPQPRYPFEHHVADALTFPLDGFDLIWASPPCQRYSMYARNMGTAHNHPDLVVPVRARLEASGVPFIIENVPGAPLRADVILCGSMFGLAVRRHRLFECSFLVGLAPAACDHSRPAIPVYGHGTPQWYRMRRGNIGLAEKRAAMGDIDWMNRDELSQAIPPAYSEWLARRFLEARRRAA
jgi:hypothetical protein